MRVYVRDHISMRRKTRAQRGGTLGSWRRGIALESRICPIAHLASVKDAYSKLTPRSQLTGINFIGETLLLLGLHGAAGQQSFAR
jgi:hypothetical protein